jgi:hypothetical protein
VSVAYRRVLMCVLVLSMNDTLWCDAADTTGRIDCLSEQQRAGPSRAKQGRAGQQAVARSASCPPLQQQQQAERQADSPPFTPPV